MQLMDALAGRQAAFQSSMRRPALHHCLSIIAVKARDLRSVMSCLFQELMAEGVLVSPRMMADHMPDYLTAVLQRLAEQVGQGIAPGEQLNGDFTIELPPSPAHAHRGRTDFSRRSSNEIGRTPSADIGRRSSANLSRKGSTDPANNRLENILRNSLATARAYADSEESIEL